MDVSGFFFLPLKLLRKCLLYVIIAININLIIGMSCSYSIRCWCYVLWRFVDCV